MPYKLAEYHGDTLAVPQLVVSHLTQTDGDTIRAALYLLQTGDTDPRTMARALGLSSVEAAKRALQYWAGAGLLVNDRGGAPIPEPEKPQKMQDYQNYGKACDALQKELKNLKDELVKL